MKRTKIRISASFIQLDSRNRRNLFDRAKRHHLAELEEIRKWKQEKKLYSKNFSHLCFSLYLYTLEKNYIYPRRYMEHKKSKRMITFWTRLKVPLDPEVVTVSFRHKHVSFSLNSLHLPHLNCNSKKENKHQLQKEKINNRILYHINKLKLHNRYVHWQRWDRFMGSI